jgi:hypothetical protein
LKGAPGGSDDMVKNLFKVLCGIMNYRLKQRDINKLDDKILKPFMDAINFDIQDDDLIILNQLATIKRLVNRKAFSLSNEQLGMLHLKFGNLFEQRMRSFSKEKRGRKDHYKEETRQKKELSPRG